MMKLLIVNWLVVVCEVTSKPSMRFKGKCAFNPVITHGLKPAKIPNIAQAIAKSHDYPYFYPFG